LPAKLLDVRKFEPTRLMEDEHILRCQEAEYPAENQPDTKTRHCREQSEPAFYPDIADDHHRKRDGRDSKLEWGRALGVIKAENQPQADHADARADEQHGKARDLDREDGSQTSDQEREGDHGQSADSEHAETTPKPHR